MNPIVDFTDDLIIWGQNTLQRKTFTPKGQNMNYWTERKRWLEVFHEWANVNHPGWEDALSETGKDQLESYISKFDFNQPARYNSQEEACLFDGQYSPLHANRPRLRFIGAWIISKERKNARRTDECGEPDDSLPE
jgi:hypothetical protein